MSSSPIVKLLLPKTEAGNDPSDHRDDPGYLLKAKPAGVALFLEEFRLTESEIEGLAHAEWVIRNLIVKGHLIVIVAEANGGKTTIFLHLSGQMARDGYRVFYVNAEIAGSDAGEFARQAEEEGWVAALPDFKAGMSMKDVIAKLHARNNSGENLSGEVLILDTLKKCVEVINKSKTRDFLQLLRSLTAKGMTVVCLAHTNKYVGVDGKPVFEGVGDIRSDCDELIYLIPAKNPDGTMIVSTQPDKVRAALEPMTFQIARDRQVTLLEGHVDTTTLRERERRFLEDEPLIAIINKIIGDSVLTQTEITQRAKGDMGRPTVTRLLRAYSGQSAGRHQQWEVERAFQDRNTIRYWRKREKKAAPLKS